MAASTKERPRTGRKIPLSVWTVTDITGNFPKQSIITSLQPVIKFSNIFGLLPLFLIRDSAQASKWKRLARTFYVLFAIVTIHLMALLNFAEYFTPSLVGRCSDVSCYMRQFIGVSFNVCCITSYLYFATTGLKKFHRILLRWDDIGQHFYVTFFTSKTIDSSTPTFFASQRFCFRFVLLYYGLVIFEHLTQDVWLIHSYVQDFQANKVHVNFFFSLFNDSYPLTYAILHYVPGSEMWLYLGGKYKVIAWNYADFIIMSIAFNLNCSLSTFSNQLTHINCKEQWKRARKIHLELCELVTSLDNLLSPIILLTLGVTTYFVCNQIYFQFKSDGENTLLRTLYGSMSIVLLALRTFGTILVSAQVQENVNMANKNFSVIQQNKLSLKIGKSVLNSLRSCPAHLYGIEVERFWDQAVDFHMSFSAAKLFQVNRRYFLTTVSVIITYELIFLGLV